jgi:hypothetical protein
MKKHLLISLLVLPFTTWAQAIDQLPARKVNAPRMLTPEQIERAITSSANPRVLELAGTTDIYRRIADATTGRYAARLRPGDYVVIRGVHQHWFAVCRAQSPTQFSTDTATYYMRKEAIKGSKTFVML